MLQLIIYLCPITLSVLYICALSQFSRLSLYAHPLLLHPLSSLTVFSPCSFAFWPLLSVADWDRICCQRWGDKTDLYHKIKTQQILNNNTQTPQWAFTHTVGHWNAKPLKSFIITLFPLISIFFPWLFLSLLFDCLPAFYFLHEVSRQTGWLRNFKHFSFWLSKLGGKKKVQTKERGNVSGLSLREGDQDRHSWSAPEVKRALKWAKSIASIICS